MSYRINGNTPPAGTNKDRLKKVFVEKEKYEEMVQPFPFEPDFMETRQNIRALYGRVDDFGFSVVPSKSRLLQVESDDNQAYYLLDVVAEAFSKMKQHYHKLKLQNKIDTSKPFLKEIKMIRAASNSVEFYNSYLSARMEEFNRTFVQSDLSIINYKTFESSLRDYVFELSKKNLPFTMSEFCVSNVCPPYQTGLVVQIDDQDCGDDALKYRDFFESPNFSIYQKVALRYGFRVDKNSPWTIYYDMSSPYALEKQREEGIYNLSSFFERYYTRVADFEIPTMTEKLHSLYESYRKFNPQYLVSNPCTPGQTRLKMRQITSPENLQQDYNSVHWMRLYSYIRAIETSKNWGQYDFEKSVKEANAVYVYRSEQQAYKMLESNFTDRTSELFHKRDLTKKNSFDTLITRFKF